MEESIQGLISIIAQTTQNNVIQCIKYAILPLEWMNITGKTTCNANKADHCEVIIQGLVNCSTTPEFIIRFTKML